MWIFISVWNHYIDRIIPDLGRSIHALVFILGKYYKLKADFNRLFMNPSGIICYLFLVFVLTVHFQFRSIPSLLQIYTGGYFSHLVSVTLSEFLFILDIFLDVDEHNEGVIEYNFLVWTPISKDIITGQCYWIEVKDNIRVFRR